MKMYTYKYEPEKGWSSRPFAKTDDARTVIILFGASEYIDNPTPIKELFKTYPRAIAVGCSTSGEIFGARISDRSLSVAVIEFAHTPVKCAEAPVPAPEASFAAGESLAKKLMDPSLRGLFVLSDGLTVNGSQLVAGINSVVPESVVVTGGLAGDGDRFSRTWVLKDRTPHSGFVTALGFYGDHVHLGHGSKGGWDIFGPERCVTKSSRNVLFELDGRPALQLYKEYLGERAAGLPATGLLFPLSLRATKSDSKSLVRTILAVDESRQSMTFAGDIPEGYLAQLMRANFDRLVQGASEAAQLTSRNNGSSAALAIAISCVGRRLVLGERTEEETEAALEVLPKGTAQVGFYSYGELSPYHRGSCDLHNQTMTLTTISER